MSKRWDAVDVPLPPLKPSEIGYHELRPIEVNVEDRYERAAAIAATVQNPEARFRAHAAGAEWIVERFGNGDWDSAAKGWVPKPGDTFKWKDNWRDIPYELLAPVFSFEELMRLRHGEVIMSEFGEWFDAHHPFLRKIMFGHWHYGCDNDWNMLVRHLDGFRRIAIDLPDFEVRIAYTRSINQCAWAWAEGLRDLYLDASFGLLLYYKGQHVLTVGFVPCAYGVLVAQAQLRQKKGNRFLFKLPKHYLDIGLDILARAFPDEPLWLIKGESSVEATRRNYGKLPCGIDEEVAARITALYNRPLEAYRRGTKTMRQDGRMFVRLHRRASMGQGEHEASPRTRPGRPRLPGMSASAPSSPAAR